MYDKYETPFGLFINRLCRLQKIINDYKNTLIVSYRNFYKGFYFVQFLGNKNYKKAFVNNLFKNDLSIF